MGNRDDEYDYLFKGESPRGGAVRVRGAWQRREAEERPNSSRPPPRVDTNQLIDVIVK